MRYICLSASCGCKWERQGLNLAKRSQDKAKSHFQSQSLDLFKCKQLSLNRSLMSRAGVNQKHEADVCLHLQGGLAVSRLPWQAGFGRCQNLELWRDSMNLPVRPGLPPAFLLFKSESWPLMASPAASPLSPEDRVAGGISVATSHVGEKWHRVLQCSMQQSPQVPGNPSLGNCGCRFHPQVVGKMLRLGRNVVQQEGGAHQADREVDLP